MLLFITSYIATFFLGCRGKCTILAKDTNFEDVCKGGRGTATQEYTFGLNEDGKSQLSAESFGSTMCKEGKGYDESFLNTPHSYVLENDGSLALFGGVYTFWKTGGCE